MGIIRTYLAAKTRLIAAEAEWDFSMAEEVRPEQIVLKAGRQLQSVQDALDADPKLAAICKKLRTKLKQPTST
jgi:hypothetical protein